MSVLQYSRRDINGLYDIKICNNQGCTVEVGFYKLKNPFPTGDDKQVYSFPTTPENDIFFVPSRVVEDPVAFKSHVLDQTRKLVSCLEIDPCNVHTQLWCCTQNELIAVDSMSRNKDILAMILIYVLFALLVIGILAVTAVFYKH
jgi:hypothetical protein